MTRLELILNQKRSVLDRYGVSISYDESRLPTSCSANLDGASYVGTITHWPDSRFEFQFNDAQSGEVLLLDEREFGANADLGAYIEELFRTKLKR